MKRKSIQKNISTAILAKLPFNTKMNEERELTFFYIMDDMNNHCATLTLSDDEITISSLRFTENQKKCTLLGAKLLQGILKLHPIVSSIKLDDQSYKVIQYKNESHKILLTPFRKFVYDQGWYEKFGFKLNSKQEWDEYNDSYAHLRHAKFADLSLFIWLLTSSLILNDIEDIDESKITTLCIQIFKICELDGYDLYKLEQKYNDKKIRINMLIDFFKHFGLQQTNYNHKLIVKLGLETTDFDKVTVWDKLKPMNAVRIWRKTLYKSNNEDLFGYILMLNEILNVLVTIDCLKAPNLWKFP